MDAIEAAEIRAKVGELMKTFAEKFRSGTVNPEEVTVATARLDFELRSTQQKPADGPGGTSVSDTVRLL
jgi:hypothetical protein